MVRGVLDRLILVAAALGGGLLPGFISQYRQRLGGRLDQARQDLQAWQHIADQLFQGDLQRLIQFHAESNDARIRAEAALIENLLAAVQHLQQAIQALRGNLYEQIAFLLIHPDPGLMRATFADWVPTFSLSVEGLTFAALFACTVWLMFQGLWTLLAAAARPRRPKLQERKVPTLGL